MTGEIVWLGRYPVKSMLGEALDEADVGASGLAGDRRYALIDVETGLVASAKHPRKWGGLLGMRARFGPGERLTVTLAGGEVVEAGDPAAELVLTRAAGRAVRLARSRPDGAGLERLTPETEPAAGEMTLNPLGAATPGDTFVDFAAVHVVTTATLAALGADARRFRPNVVLRGAEPFAENEWVGRTLRLGADVEVRIVAPTPRCAVPTLAQGGPGGLPADPSVLRTAARLNRVPVLDMGNLTCVGAYGSIARGGRLRLGDRATVGP